MKKNYEKSVIKYPSMIKYIENPNEKIQLSAEAYGLVIEHIKLPSNSVQLEAVKLEWFCT